jgi:hypothetical protein
MRLLASRKFDDLPCRYAADTVTPADGSQSLSVESLAGMVTQADIHRYVSRVLGVASSDYSEITLTFRTLEAGMILPLSGLANPTRLQKACVLVGSLREAGVSVFEPSFFRKPTERWYRLSMPPIVEDHGGAFVLIDGLHRTIAAQLAGYRQIGVVLVSGSLPPVPANPRTWQSVRLVSSPTLGHLSGFLPRPVGRRLKFDAYDGNYFRPLGRFLGSSSFWFKSPDEIHDHVTSVAGACSDTAGEHFELRELSEYSPSPQLYWRYA